MDKNQKSEKKRIISEKIDLGNGRYKDEEIDKLFDLTNKPEICSLLNKTITNSYTGFSSDGKYTRNEETTYECNQDDRGIQLVKKYQYSDDDGQTGKSETQTNNGREILNILKSVFKK